MIKTIEITKREKCLQKGFKMELKKMTIITGKNNCGKSSFGELLETKNFKATDDKDNGIDNEKIKVVYISAENQQPENDELKSGASTLFVKNLADLFSNLGINFKLNRDDVIRKKIQELFEKANENLEELSGGSEHNLDIKLKDQLNNTEILKSMIERVVVKELCGMDDESQGIIEERKLELLGSGTKRIIIVSILKAYLDLLKKNGFHGDDNILIVIDEPELHLHPDLKRKLNSILESISMIDGRKHQIVIITHDPYFIFSNSNDNDKKICSFVKEKNQVAEEDGVIDGIEDELLFIMLYSNLLNKGKTKTQLGNIDITDLKDRTYFSKTHKNGQKNLVYIRDTIHHSGDNENSVGMKEDGYSSPAGVEENYYTGSELSEAIKKMSEELGK